MGRTGLTMVELVMIVVILGVAGLIIGPSITETINSRNLEVEVRKLVTNLREVQQRSKGNPDYNYGIAFDLSSECYDTGYTYLSVWNNVENYCVGGMDIQNTDWPASTPAHSVRFDQFGAPQTGGRIWIRNPADGELAIIYVDTATGRIKVSFM